MATFSNLLATFSNQKNEFCDLHKKTYYCCEKCDYNTCKLTDYKRHLLTRKHTSNQKNEKNEKNEKINEYMYVCKNCNKEYCDKSGLWRHNKTCKIVQYDTVENKDICDKELVLTLLKQNAELLEIFKNGTFNHIVNTNNSYNNCNNKTFNLQVFLNETCKDAMNISDFVESIKLQVSDLENVGKVGYIEGISNIIIKNLQALDVEKRPVHCTDQKREVMYVKDENIWEKEDETNKKLRKAIRTIAHKNICMLKAFREKYPDCEEYNSKKNSQYNKIVIEAMGGKGDDDFEKDSKIIKKIAKTVGIDKN
jgi:hypothetical protein